MAEAVRLHGRDVIPSCLSLLHALLEPVRPAEYFENASLSTCIEDSGALELMRTELEGLTTYSYSSPPNPGAAGVQQHEAGVAESRKVNAMRDSLARLQRAVGRLGRDDDWLGVHCDMSGAVPQKRTTATPISAGKVVEEMIAVREALP